MKSVLFIGNANKQDYQTLRAAGFRILVICDPGTIYKCDPRENFDGYWEANLRENKDEAFQIIENLLANLGRNLIVLNVGETFVEFTSEVSERFNLPGLSRLSATLSLEKAAMKNCFLKNIGPQSTAPFLQLTVTSEDSLEDASATILAFAEKHAFPLVVKPCNLYGSFFTTISKNEHELEINLKLAVDGIRAHLSSSADASDVVEIQVEKFLAGSVHSIDCVIQDGNIQATPVIDVQTGNDLGRDDFFHFARMAPSWLTTEQQQDMKRLAFEGVRALGIRWGVAHVEIIQTNNGPRLLEIGARPGGNRVDMLNLAFGIDLMTAYAKAMDGDPSFTDHLAIQRQLPTVILSPFPLFEGVVTSIPGLATIKDWPTYLDHSVSVKRGDKIGRAKHGYPNCVKIKLQSDRWNDLKPYMAELASDREFFNLETIS
jgi:ATP-grasp domain